MSTIIQDVKCKSTPEEADFQRENKNLKEIYENYYDVVYMKCFSILRDEQLAEDATQTVFYKLMIKFDGLKDYNKLYGWFMKVSRTTCIDIINKRQREIISDEVMVNLIYEESGNEFLEECLEIVATFPLKYHKIFYLKYVDGLTDKQIAEELNLPLTTVKGRLRVCLELLRKYLLNRKF